MFGIFAAVVEGVKPRYRVSLNPCCQETDNPSLKGGCQYAAREIATKDARSVGSLATEAQLGRDIKSGLCIGSL